MKANTMFAVSKVSQARAVEVWERISDLHTTIAAVLEKEMLPQAGISLGWYQVLGDLKRAPGAMLRFQNLAKEAGLSESGASRRLEQMMKAGLIDRVSCPTDRRGVYAHVTEAGLEAYERAHLIFIKSVDEALSSRLKPEEAEAIRSTLSRLGACD
ncbi:MAG TPA: MarR family transcriptional regulator [Patescibacteria group bacterium]|nr:MarR family transcriptional regulator [Patescibacteria group bacterium]